MRKPYGSDEHDTAAIRNNTYQYETPAPDYVPGCPRKRRTRYCKLCGGPLNARRYCPACGKQYFHFRWPHLFVIVLSLICAVSLWANMELSDRYRDALTSYHQISGEKRELSQEYEAYKKKVQPATHAPPKNTPEPTAPPAPQKRISDPTVPPAADTQAPPRRTLTPAKKCPAPGCDSEVYLLNKPYCTQHRCLEVGCERLKTDSLSHYCDEHVCDSPGCHSGKGIQSNYCILHQMG